MDDNDLADQLRNILKLYVYPNSSTNTGCKKLQNLGLVNSRNAKLGQRYGGTTRTHGVRLTKDGEKLAELLIETARGFINEKH